MKSFDDLQSMMNWLKANIETLHAAYGASNIRIFGSYVTGNIRPGSDVDMLVTLDEPTFDRYMNLKFYLEGVFGRSIDLVTEGAL